ncbi:MAG TPA: heterodisulfide reductase subunit A [Sedimenticola sp.]|nr:heterodisulfide reductase subunit A [Sedimenticola sp.]
MRTATIQKSDLGKAIDLLVQADLRVIAPRLQPRLEEDGPDAIDVLTLVEVKSGENHQVGEGLLPLNGVKEFLFAKHEPLFAYEKRGKKIDIIPVHHEYPRTVIVGVRPCDAASIASLNAVFSDANAGFEDPFFTRRRERTTIVTYSCTAPDASCFCTSVDLAPDSSRGSDLHFTEIGGDLIHVEVLTEAGEAIANLLESLLEGEGDQQQREKAGAAVKEKLTRIRDAAPIKDWLDNLDNFDDEMWERLGEKCIGCGSCTFLCPTCHCFDIVDENKGSKGYRVKFWDSCQFDHFTLHASGHNPRDWQYKRYRNRFNCKFKIYPEKFEQQGCVGCGRCIRGCPVNLDITEYMAEVAAKAAG